MSNESLLSLTVLLLTASAAGCEGDTGLATGAMQEATTSALDAGADDASIFVDGRVPDAEDAIRDHTEPGGACDQLEICCVSLPEQSRNWCEHNVGLLRASGDPACARVMDAYCLER